LKRRWKTAGLPVQIAADQVYPWKVGTVQFVMERERSTSDGRILYMRTLRRDFSKGTF
jgi:hypothetical protein